MKGIRLSKRVREREEKKEMCTHFYIPYEQRYSSPADETNKQQYGMKRLEEIYSRQSYLMHFGLTNTLSLPCRRRRLGLFRLSLYFLLFFHIFFWVHMLDVFRSVIFIMQRTYTAPVGLSFRIPPFSDCSRLGPSRMALGERKDRPAQGIFGRGKV